MTKLRLLAVLILLLLLGSGVALVKGRKPDALFAYPSVAWRATSDLLAGHQIRQGELKLPSHWFQPSDIPVSQYQVGRYLLTSKHKDELVLPTDLADVPPVLPTDSSYVALIYSPKEQEHILATLEPGMFLKVCSAEAKDSNGVQCSSALGIVAVHLSTSSTDSPWLALRVPIGNLEKTSGLIALPAKAAAVVKVPDQEK